MSTEIKYYSQPADALPDFMQVSQQVYGTSSKPEQVKVNQEYLLVCIVVFEKNMPVARCCLYNNSHINYQEKSTLLIGNVECINSYEIFSQIMKAVRMKADELGKQYIVGPIDGSTWDNYRFATSTSQDLFFTEQRSAGWYPIFFERYGFNTIATYQSSKGVPNPPDILIHAQVRNSFENNGILFREIKLNTFEDELRQIHALSLEAFEQSFFYSPISFNHFYEKYLPIKTFIHPRYVLLAEDKNNRLVAFIFCIPDVYNTNRLIIKTIACRHDMRGTGLITWMTNEIFRRVTEDGFVQVVHAFMHVENPSVRLSAGFGGQPFRQYDLYGMNI